MIKNVTSLVDCQQADLTRVGGKALNWNRGGIAIKTNCPICVGAQLTVEFVEPKTFNLYKVKEQVVWRQFHGASSVQTETLFTAGIKFLTFRNSTKRAFNLIIPCSLLQG